MLDSLVGVSHECDYPVEVSRKPRVTHCEIHGAGLPSAEVDRWVRERLRASGTLYTIDENLVRRLRPDAILTQRLCDVCAVAYGTVAGFAVTLPGPPRVVNLEPPSLADILHDIRAVGEVLGVPERAEVVVASLAGRVEAVRRRAAGAPRLRCALLEWIDPPFCAGHWGPELVEIAGGTDPLGRHGEDSVAIPWDAVLEAAPEVLVVACCGYSVERALDDLPILRSPGSCTPRSSAVGSLSAAYCGSGDREPSRVAPALHEARRTGEGGFVGLLTTVTSCSAACRCTTSGRACSTGRSQRWRCPVLRSGFRMCGLFGNCRGIGCKNLLLVPLSR
jgi:iron complex transport system substrate-binding protein